MAKKTVASLQTSSKIIKSHQDGEISKTGAFVESIMAPELVEEFLKRIN
jgi:hypothetical protein